MSEKFEPVYRQLPAAALAGMMLELQKQGCVNINLVTPSHRQPPGQGRIPAEDLELASQAGLKRLAERACCPTAGSAARSAVSFNHAG